MRFSSWLFFITLQERGGVSSKGILNRQVVAKDDAAEAAFRTVRAYGRAAASADQRVAGDLIHQVLSTGVDWEALRATLERGEHLSEPWRELVNPANRLLQTVVSAASTAFDRLLRSPQSPYVRNGSHFVWRSRSIPMSDLNSAEYLSWLDLDFGAELVRGILTRPQPADLPNGVDATLVLSPHFKVELTRTLSGYESDCGRLETAPPALTEFVERLSTHTN